jgi:hypothetical protein
MSYQAVRFCAGRTGWAVIMTVCSPNGERTFVKKNLTKKQANSIAESFNGREVLVDR